MTHEAARAFWRRVGPAAAIEFAVELIMAVILAIVTFKTPNGIGKILAITAVVLIMIAWAFRVRRRIVRWK